MNFRRLCVSDAVAIAKWRYAGEYSVYDISAEAVESSVRYMTDPNNRFFGAYQAEELVGFFSVGTDGQVPGGIYDDASVDLGAGMRPDLVGNREGARFLKGVIEFVESEIDQRNLRATIASWNERALRAASRVGFHAQITFLHSDGRRFAILVRDSMSDRSLPTEQDAKMPNSPQTS